MISDSLSVTFAALADPTRRSILAQLSRGEATVTELAAPHAMSLPAISRHLKVLEHAGPGRQGPGGAVAAVPTGASRRCATWTTGSTTYREFFEQRFDQLAEHLATMVREQRPAPPDPEEQR